MQKAKVILFILFTIASLRGMAQGQIDFSSTEWDFGSIRESDGRVSHVFTGTNRGNKPLVILDVVSSCGCTASEFSRKPVAPGAAVQVKVTFDPTNRPGAFIKELGVYTSEREKAATLSVRGTVIPRKKSVEELYPVDAGGGVRFSESLCAFSYIYIGQSVQTSVGYVNTGDRAVRLELRPQLRSRFLTIDAAAEIAPNQRGEVAFSYLIPSDAPHYGTVRDALEVFVDGKSRGTILVVHGIAIDRPVEGGQNAPKADFSENMIKFGTVKHHESLQRRAFTLTNTGSGELIVRAVENQGCVATTLTPGLRLAPGATFRAEVMLLPKSQEYGTLVDHLVVITNDPSRPMRRLRVTAVVEE